MALFFPEGPRPEQTPEIKSGCFSGILRLSFSVGVFGILCSAPRQISDSPSFFMFLAHNNTPRRLTFTRIAARVGGCHPKRSDIHWRRPEDISGVDGGCSICMTDMGTAFLYTGFPQDPSSGRPDGRHVSCQIVRLRYCLQWDRVYLLACVSGVCAT